VSRLISNWHFGLSPHRCTYT